MACATGTSQARSAVSRRSQYLLAADRLASTVSRAYYAAYQAMWAALGDAPRAEGWRQGRLSTILYAAIGSLPHIRLRVRACWSRSASGSGDSTSSASGLITMRVTFCGRVR